MSNNKFVALIIALVLGVGSIAEAQAVRTAISSGSRKSGLGGIVTGGVSIDPTETLIAAIATDPIALTSVTVAGIAMTLDRAHTTGDVYTRIYRYYNNTGSTVSGTVTFSWSGTSTGAYFLTEFSSVPSTQPDAVGSANGTGTSPSTGSVNRPSSDTFAIAALGTEGPSGDAAGTWSNGYTAGQRAGTTGGGDATNITIQEGYKDYEAAGSEAAALTSITSRDWSIAVDVLFESNATPRRLPLIGVGP